jgi:DNA repair protein RadC
MDTYDLTHSTTTELVALLLGGELHDAEMLLSRCDGLRGLAQASPADLNDLSESERARILAAMELAKRLMGYIPGERRVVRKAEDAAQLMADMSLLRQEHVRAILLDMNRQVIAVPTLYIGTLNASVLRVSEIFREAILRNSPAMILAHNHPAGDHSPSPEDVELTRTLIAAGKLLDISLLDHLIIGQNGWSSIKEMSLAF